MSTRGKSTGGGRQRSTRGGNIIRILTGPKPGPKKKLDKQKKRPGQKGEPKINLDLANIVVAYLSESYRNGPMTDPPPKEREKQTERLERIRKDLIWCHDLHRGRLTEAQKNKESFRIRIGNTNSPAFTQYMEKLDGEVRNQFVQLREIEEALKKNSESISAHAEYCENADLFEKNKKIREEREKGRTREMCKSDQGKTKELCKTCKKNTKNGRLKKGHFCKTCNARKKLPKKQID